VVVMVVVVLVLEKFCSDSGDAFSVFHPSCDHGGDTDGVDNDTL